MNALRSYATRHPVMFVLSLTIAWLIVLLVFTGIASSALHRPFGDAVTGTIGRLTITACILLLVWRLGWLEASGVARLGRWPVWLLALGGMTYFTIASLYSYFSKINFDFSSLIQIPDARAIVMSQFAVSLCEEILFRGVVLYSLARVWENTKRGMIGSVVLSSLIFAVLHMTNVFAQEIPLSSALLLTLETCIIAIWWGALVLWGGSIWPAVMLHFVSNAVVAVQGLTIPMVEPNIVAYRQLLFFSILLGVLGVGLLVQAVPRRVVPEVL
jgi:membrane protease YdiL (CAAX protease family)